MLESTRLNNERIKLQSEINAMPELRADDEDAATKLGERNAKLQQLAALGEQVIAATETEARDAEIAMARSVDSDGLTKEQRDFRDLGQRTNRDQYFFAGLNVRDLPAGPERDYNDHVFGTGAWNIGDMPVEMLLDRDREIKRDELEEMRTVITGVVGTAGQPTFVDRIFNSSDGAFLGAIYPAVGPGRHSYPVVSSRTAAQERSRDQAVTLDGGISVETADPTRLQAAYELAKSDELQMPGIGAAFASHIRSRLVDALDNKVVDDLTAGLTEIDDNVVLTFATLLGKFGGVVDGRAAKTVNDVRMLVTTTPVNADGTGTNTYAFAAGLSSSGSHFFNTIPHDRFRGSPHFPRRNGTDSHQIAIGVRTGPGPATLIAPVWRRAELLRDTGRLAAKDQITISGAMYADVIVASTDRHAQLEMTLA